MNREELEHKVFNDPDNADYDISIVSKMNKVIVVYREKGQYNVSHTEVYEQVVSI
jgi:hypothetical protein